MARSTFFVRFAVVSFVATILLLALHFSWPVFQKHWPVSLASLLFFEAVSVALFFIGERLAQSKSRLAFNNLIIASVFVKILFSLVIVLVYFKMQHPTDRFFILPFLLTYVIFTIFETWFMMKLAQLKPAN